MKRTFKPLLLFAGLVLGAISAGAQGLEQIIVEQYYEASAADAAASEFGDGDGIAVLVAGSRTYRIYADLLPGYKLETVFGNTAHPLNLATTTFFYNQTDRGTALGHTNATGRLDENTCSIDSYLTFGMAGSTKRGVLKSADADATSVIFPNSEGSPVMENQTAWMGTALTAADGLATGTLITTQTIGISDLSAFTGNATGTFTTNNGAWFVLGGAQGEDPNGTNRILIAQITTNGALSFNLNMRVSPLAGGSFTDYVSSNPTGAEQTIPSLTFPVACVPVAITGVTSNSPVCSTDTLFLGATVTGDAPISYSWSGTGTIINGNTANAKVVGAATGNYTISVTNACGSDNDVVAVTVNTATLWYADADSDGFGDPAQDSLSCAQPAGYVANNTDQCPSDLLKQVPGACGCGVPDTDTDNDGIADCIDSCPSLPGQIGSPCNDNNACTTGDVINASCQCVGSLPAATWDMTTAPATTNTFTNAAVSDIGRGNNNGTTTLLTTTSASSGYGGATGTFNAGAACFVGALNTATSTYFEFTVTPNAGFIFTLNGVNFGTRSTSTGPQLYSIRTSADNYAADIASGAIANNSTWSLKTNSGLSTASLNGQALTVRIYGSNGTGSPGANTANWRIDDLAVSGCVSAVACVPVSITGVTSNSPICSTDDLALGVTVTGDGPIGYTWTGVGTITNGNTANATVSGAATGNYNIAVSNACGSANQDVAVVVNTATLWYADVDGDTFGDPAVDSLDCTQPVGYVANNTDNCPAVAGLIGSTCDDGNANTIGDVLDATCTCVGTPVTAITGCSSSQSPYLLPLGAGNTTTSILTVGDLIGGYDMVGIPDGMGAFDNNDGTFTLLVNHELGATVGTTRAHGFAGSFVSKWVINKSNLCVQSGADLITNLQTWNGSSYVPATAAMGRLCSGDLPAISAFYNAGTGKGTQERIFLSGEEVGAEGRAFAHIASGANAGTSYELPYLGKFSWENALASPAAQDKTIVIGLDDTTPGQLYVYVGEKRSTGTEIEKAGLDDGNLYGVKVSGIALESAGTYPSTSTAFSLHNFGNVASTTGAALQTASVANGVTEFLRPEDGHFDPSNPNVFYFVTTASFTGPSRMYKMTFTDILQPELGGTIVAVLDGTEGQKMMDNMCVDQRGNAFIQEDPGNQAHIAKLWKYEIATDVFTQVGYADSARFITGAPLFLTQDEEHSGIIDMQDILGKGKYLFNVQAHYPIPGELVEGGQLLEFSTNDTLQLCVAPTLASITGAQTLCSADTLELAAAFNGTPDLSYSWSGTGTFLFNSGNASALVTGAASGTYTVTATNACGTAQGTVNVTVTPSTSSSVTESACDSYTWAANGQVYTASGTYTNTVGCNTDTLVLTITPSTGGSQTESACGSFTWSANGQVYTSSGTYTNTVGCNTDTLVLTITPVTGGSTTASACDSYTWSANGQTYTASGTYTHTVACNTDTLVLTINLSSGSTTTVSACDSYTWSANGQTYTASGTYTNTNACNTDTLVLTIAPITGGSTTASACGSYTWSANGQTYTASGTYTNTVACNTDTLVLTITPITGGSTAVNACDSYTWSVNGQTYTMSGTYTHTVACNTDTLVLTVAPTTGSSTSATGCGTYVWSANGQTYTASGTYTHTVGCNTDTLVLTLSIPGTACDDGNPNTAGDVLNASCVCQGSLPCTEELILTIDLDALGSQTTWAVKENGTNNVVASGGPYTDGTPGQVIEAICVETGCYSFELFDSFGDGLASTGYVLTDDQGRRIIDANGLFGSVSSSVIPGDADFCVPLGPTFIKDNWCDRTNLTPSSFIYARGVAGATAYQFWFFDPHGSYSRRIQKPTTTCQLNWATQPIPLGVELNVSVRALVAGNYTAFGKVCTALLPGGGGSLQMLVEETGAMQLYPNPTSGENVTLMINGLNDEVMQAEITVLDVFGKVVMSRTLATDGAEEVSTVIELDGSMANGVYLVNVTAGDRTMVERLIVH